MPTMTITEAMSERKMTDKRIEKKRIAIAQYLLRPEQVRDPLEKEGGSRKFVEQELQSIKDLEENKVLITRAIARANETTSITVAGMTRTIADWLVWRRDVLPGRSNFLNQVRAVIERQRQEALKKGANTISDVAAAKTGDIVVNLNEKDLLDAIENLSAVTETLDGQLSLKNATTTVTW